LIKKVNVAKRELFKKIRAGLKDSHDGYSDVEKDKLSTEYIKDFLKFIIVAYPEDQLLITSKENESGYYPNSLLSKTNDLRKTAYTYFLKYVVGILLSLPINESSVEEPLPVSLLDVHNVLKRIESFLQQHFTYTAGFSIKSQHQSHKKRY
jgi:hypothetical protein